ncbi:MAG TPA: LamG-like jellyroll fold domain-containing protein [Bryobacteraceae bacterium]|nr:LamG-like jellyroll fold domain-containing protein [Bryobacteraceae bacterium]
MLKQSVARLAVLGIAAAGGWWLWGADGSAASEVWRFDNLERIGGYAVTVLGHPRLIDTPAGRAVEFNGVDDALFIDAHPLAGARAFTWEVIFRPDAGGKPEQRFFHLQERDAATGRDRTARMLFEIRVIGGQWCLDSFVGSADAARSRTLIDRAKLHSLGAWHYAAEVYDGHEFRNYVDGVEQEASAVEFAPQGPGHSSIGVRINKLYYFKGAMFLGRMTRRALAPAEFVKVEGLR